MTVKGSGEQRVVGDGYWERGGRACSPCCGADGPPRCLAWCPPSLICCPQSSELQEQEETIWSFCASVAGCYGIFQAESGYLLNCFPHRLVCCEALQASLYWLSFKDKGTCFGKMLSGSVHILDFFYKWVCVCRS